jgi:hypothetical protein
MKLLSITCLCLLLAAGPALSQGKYLKEFQQEYSGNANTFRMGLTFFIKMGGMVVPARALGDEDGVIVKRLLKKVSYLKVYMVSGADSIDNGSIRRLRQKLINKSHLEPLLEIRDQGSTVFMMNKGKGDELGNVVLLVKDEQDLVMVHFHTSMLMSDIQDLIDRSVAHNETKN